MFHTVDVQQVIFRYHFHNMRQFTAVILVIIYALQNYLCIARHKNTIFYSIMQFYTRKSINSLNYFPLHLTAEPYFPKLIFSGQELKNIIFNARICSFVVFLQKKINIYAEVRFSIDFISFFCCLHTGRQLRANRHSQPGNTQKVQ